ncbi:MAG: hypothetical protein HZB83_09190 [Deltaproteobacteria bacterium]|nr:hypothetical protein [Deltaproteobacteria bacterium]
MKTLGERLQYIREKTLQVSREKFIEKLGISVRTLASYEYNDTSPDAVFLNKMWAKYHKELSMADFEWLMTGKRVEYTVAISTPVLGRVPAGFPENVANEDILEYLSLPDAPKGAFALVVDDNSMSPEVRDGDYVIFLPVEKSGIRPGDMVVANNELGQTMIKRYELKDGGPYLKSDNPEYPSFEMNENYRMVGRVTDVWSRKKLRRTT